MNYEKAYKEAIERAKNVLNGKAIDREPGTRIPEYIFPVLRDSEDERIRKEILEYFQQFENEELRGVNISDWIYWLEKQGESKFEQCIQEGDEIVTNEDGTHFNISQLERVSQKATDTKETAKEFLKSANIMDENDELADEYRFEKQGKDKEINNFDVIPGLYKCVHRMFDGTPDGKLLFEVGNIYKCLSKHDRAEFEVSYGHSVYLEDPVVCKHFIPLEKQGEQKQDPCKECDFPKLNCENFPCINKKAFEQGKSVFDVTNEPKFNDGDWVVCEITGSVYQIENCIENPNNHKCGYLTNGGYISSSEVNHYHLWTIQDAKDGDVICAYPNANHPWIGIFCKLNDEGTFNSHCYLQAGQHGQFCIPNEENIFGKRNAYNHSSKDVVPATKEQRETLFRVMKEAGYEWNADKKELKKIDSYCQKNCKGYQETGKCFADGECQVKKDAESTWSEEDEERIREIIEYLNELYDKYRFDLNELNDKEHWLKSLKEKLHPQWKPSEEQIQALEYQVNSTYKDSWQYRASKELLEQLKKL